MKKLVWLAALVGLLAAAPAFAQGGATRVTIIGTSGGGATVTGGKLDVNASVSASISTFAPTGQAALSVTSSTGRVALGSADTTALVVNTGSNVAYVKFGSNSVTAATTDYPVPAGWGIAFNVGSNTYIAAITASSTTTLTITSGTGMPALTGGGGGGSSGGSTYGAAFPGTGQAVGFNDGTNMQAGKIFDLDSGAGTDYIIATAPRIPASGGSAAVTNQAAGADNVSNTYNGYLSPTLGYYYDGSTWDRVRGDSTDGMLVNLGANNDVTVTSGTITTITNALPTGSNIIGKVGIDQTTPGTTNAISVKYMNTTAVATGSGAMDGGTQRTALATDSPGIIPTVAMTAATAPTQAVGTVGIYNTSLPTLTTGQSAGLQLDSSGRQLVTANVPSGGIASGAIASGAVASGAYASGAYAAGSIASGAVAAGAASFVKLEDVAAADGDAGVPSMAIQKATPADTAADGDYSPIQMSAGRVWTTTNVGTIGAVAVATGNGVTGTGSQRVTIASDNTPFPVKIDQTTPGTTNAVSIAQIGGTTIVNGGVAGSQSVGGTVATNVAITANPINLGAQAVSSENAAVTTARQVQLTADLVGKLIVLPYANPENFVSGVTAAMTGTTSTSLIAAPASGLRNYVTQLVCTNSHATVGTFVLVQDGSGGTTIYEAYAAAVGGGFTISFPTPLRQPTTATALFVQDVTTGSNVICAGSGYKGA